MRKFDKLFACMMQIFSYLYRTCLNKNFNMAKKDETLHLRSCIFYPNNKKGVVIKKERKLSCDTKITWNYKIINLKSSSFDIPCRSFILASYYAKFQKAKDLSTEKRYKNFPVTFYQIKRLLIMISCPINLFLDVILPYQLCPLGLSFVESK